MKPEDNKRKLIIGASVLAATGVIIAGAVIVKNQSKSQTTTDTTSAATPSDSSAAPNTDTSTQANTAVNYKDGTYTATGSYSSPGGNEKITIGVTIVDDVVTATTAQEQAASRDGEQYQELFISNYKSLIVGKTIDKATLQRVSGSSLTSNGFNDALEKIKEQARA